MRQVAIDIYRTKTPCGTPSATALLNNNRQQVMQTHNNTPANRFFGAVRLSDFLTARSQTPSGSLKKKISIIVRAITEKRRKIGNSIMKNSLYSAATKAWVMP